MSENKTSNDYSAIALVHSALAGACLLISLSKEIKSCIGLADSAYVLVRYNEVAGGELEKHSLLFVNALKMARSNLQDFAGHVDPNRLLLNRYCRLTQLSG